MADILAWLENNKGWVFSGIGVSCIGLVLRKARRLLWRGEPTQPQTSVAQNSSIAQAPAIQASPAITQAPVFNINNSIAPEVHHQAPANAPVPSIQAPLFALNPLVVTRDLMTVTGSSSDDAVECCVARFKAHNGLNDWIPSRFEASVHYVERLSANGLPYEHDAGHLNQALWLNESNGVHELLLVIRRGGNLYAVSGEEDDRFFPAEKGIVPLFLQEDRADVTVTLTDTTNGLRWRVVYAVGTNPDEMLTVRETSGLRRGY